jgi:hypothetical protein
MPDGRTTQMGDPGSPAPAVGPAASDVYEPGDEGLGWIVFAGTMLGVVGTLNVIYGIAAISNSRFYVHDVAYLFGSLKTWGWFLLIAGAIQVISAVGIWSGNQAARWVGIASAAANAVIQMLAIPSYPFLSLTLFALDILVMYGLLAYGGRGRTALE